MISECLTEIMDPFDLSGAGASRSVSSRCSPSFAKTTLRLEPEQPFLGTVRLAALAYRMSTSRSSIRTATSAFSET